jgi:hypothetical protein
LITPFSAETAGGENMTVFTGVQEAIRAAAEETGLDLRRADDIFAAGVVIQQVRGEIEQADVVLAVCSGRNANVFYELGLAEAAGKPQILIAASKVDLPFDVGHLRAQLYREGLDTLASRVALAIRETLEANPPVEYRDTPASARPTEIAGGHDEDPLELVRRDDRVGFVEGARRRIRQAQERHREVAEANSAVTPSDDVFAELAELRDSSAETVALWLAPAVEYRPDFLERPLREMSEAFGLSVLASTGGATFWPSLHRAWLSLSFKAALAFAVHRESPDAVQHLLRLRAPGSLKERDEAPLLLNPGFTFNAGYMGDARVAFDDFLRFASGSDLIGEIATTNDDRMNVVCGTDLVVGLARWILEANTPAEISLSSFHRPYTYAGFAAYYCYRIQHVAKLLESSQDMAVALGAGSLAHFREQARNAFEAVSHQIESGRRSTCDSWDEALSR